MENIIPLSCVFALYIAAKPDIIGSEPTPEERTWISVRLFLFTVPLNQLFSSIFVSKKNVFKDIVNEFIFKCLSFLICALIMWYFWRTWACVHNTVSASFFCNNYMYWKALPFLSPRSFHWAEVNAICIITRYHKDIQVIVHKLLCGSGLLLRNSEKQRRKIILDMPTLIHMGNNL